MTSPLRVLIVEDNEDDAELLLRELRRGGFEPIYQRVETPQGMTAALTEAWDVVVSDWGMPHFSALQALALLKESQADRPFIIVSGTVGEEAAVAALQAGAHDFIAKGRLTRLIPAIDREMREAAGRAERRLIEQQLRRAQKMEAMGQLTGGIAHDFNNLLGIIAANADLLLEAVKADPDKTELANEIINTAMHGADLTRRLLAFARQQPLTPQIVDLNQRLPSIIAMLQRTLGEGISIRIGFADGLWETLVDPSQVEDVLLNLAINARDAMPNGGKLTIETANMRLDSDYASVHDEVAPGDYVMLSLTDTGTGMPPEVIERATEPFFTTKEPGKGTGLGLSMIYGFAKQSGGHLNIYSEVDVGTTVRLYLPRARGKDEGPAVAATPEPTQSASDEMILLVDDNSALRRATVRRLTAMGYQVHDAEDGPTALEIIAGGKGFDLLFTDIGLPGGMSGFQLAQEAQRRLPGLRVLYTTGYGNSGAQDGDVPGQVEHLIRKPYTGQELASKLRAALARHGGP